MSKNECGDCSFCCIAPTVPEMDKPLYTPCKALGRDCKGCTIYPTRPERCRDFKCGWLSGMRRGGGKGPAHLRPDRCGVMFASGTDETVIGVFVDQERPDAWRKGQVYDMITGLANGGIKVVITCGPGNRKILAHKILDTVVIQPIDMTDPDEDGVQWIAKSPWESLT